MSEIRRLNSCDLPRLPRRPRDAHKTGVGVVYVLGGSYGMAGAAYLAAAASLRAGAGYVRLACPESIYPIVATLVPSAVFVPLACGPDKVVLSSEAGRALETASNADAVVIGPGMGDSEEAAKLFHAVLERLEKPLVLDANALGFLGRRRELLKRLGPGCVLTPHPGEMAALLGVKAGDVQADREGAVRRLAEESGAVAVLKGAGTLVCDGGRIYENTSGNAGMAKAGSGDVLAGVTGAFLARGIAPFEAAMLAVYLHGKAGDAAAGRLAAGLDGRDIIEEIAYAIREFQRGRFERGG